MSILSLVRSRLFIAALVLGVTLIVVAACNGDDDDGDGDRETPAADETPADNPDAVLRAEAEALCPAQFVEPCTDEYIAAAKGSLKAALCKTPGIPDGKWFFETPQGEVGEACSDGETAIFAIVGGE